MRISDWSSDVCSSDLTLVNRIAAGEVIERPASAIKELVDNAIDAGATRIDISIAGGGRNLIRVADDRKGNGSDELTVAVERHAPRSEEQTSVLQSLMRTSYAVFFSQK